jgi:isopenicillin-N epimerase
LPNAARADEVLGSVEAAITPRTRVAVFDHITSNSAVQLPVSRLTALCREKGVLTVVDQLNMNPNQP